MRSSLPIILIIILTTGCQKFLVRTDNKVSITGPVDTRVVADNSAR